MDQRILGYSNEISVQPGDSLDFLVSCYEVDSYDAEIVRLIHGDVNPEGPGFRSERIESIPTQHIKGRQQDVYCGSYAIIPGDNRMRLGDGFTIQCRLWPTTPDKGVQAILGQWSQDCDEGVQLAIDSSGCLALIVVTSAQRAMVSTGIPLVMRAWYFVAASYDPVSGRVCVYQEALDSSLGESASGTKSKELGDIPTGVNGGNAFIAASPIRKRGKRWETGEHYNGKIERPAVIRRPIDRYEMAKIEGAVTTLLNKDVVACWDFCRGIEGVTITDISPNELHGQLVNLPARAMKGSRWTGESMAWTERPEHYGAIHFHDDDVYDAGWEVDFSVTLPEALNSGVYAARLSNGEIEDYVPFFVRPGKGAKRSDLVFIAPTASYLAYANDHMEIDAPFAQFAVDQVIRMEPQDVFLAEHREYGGSTYDTHSDGSGVCYSSRLRPILNMRPKYAMWLGGSGSTLWQFNADLHLIYWLEEKGFDYDVITDEDLHRDGYGALKHYRVAITGTHPEYTSTRMRDAYEAFANEGGRFMYMGGNGFYWRISKSEELPGVIEIRKAEDGIRAWAAEPGEYYNAFNGDYSGLWRRSGRPPQQLCGVGFSAQGFDVSSYYRCQPDAYNERASFIFDGVDCDAKIGDFGLIGGGAAGLELDRADRLLGTPPHALVLASSEDHTNRYMVVCEEILINAQGLCGSHPLVRADLVFFETRSGGAVFSTGSIAYCGSLLYNNCDNNVSKLTENVLNRFLAPEAFTIPPISEWPNSN